MLTFLIVLACIGSYLFTAGTVGRKFYAVSAVRCDRCSGRNRRSCVATHEVSAFFTGVLFPLSVPLMLGMYGPAHSFGSGGNRISRDEKRRTRELTEAKHKEELAKIQARTTRELERALED